MSNFMDFLDKIDNTIIEESYSDIEYEEDVDDFDEYEEDENDKKVTSTNTKKDASVKYIEKRMKNKLDDIGLNERVINDVISYVLDGVDNIKGVNETYTNTNINVQDEIPAPTNIISRAEALLEGLPETPTYSNMYMNNTSNNNTINDVAPSNLNLSNIADHASALLG